MITTVTGKNRVTIPAKLAREAGIRPGTRISWKLADDGTLVGQIQSWRGELARQVAGMGKSWLPEGESAVEQLIEERASSCE
jgi:bifunctional DNA-binding transcriptional regulator/antitoxin component of YhaV-PrlF toxin-antitoxin module